MKVDTSRLKRDIENPQVYQPVPLESRNNYAYWRGVNLTRLALELASERSERDDIYFAPQYSDALDFAKDTASSIMANTPQELVGAIRDTLGLRMDRRTPQPSIVVAHNDTEVNAKPGTLDWVIIDANWRNFDPFSREFIEDYFKLSLKDNFAQSMHK